MSEATPIEGRTHPPIRDLQWQLSGHNRHELRTYHGAIDGINGPQTNVAIRDMKRALGYPTDLIDARLDGDRGRKLSRYLKPIRQGGYPLPPAYQKRKRERAKQHPSKVARLLHVAAAEIGVREDPMGSNSGPRVRVYQSHTFLGGTGWPWCAAFVNFCMDMAGVGLPYKTAGVPDLHGWAQRHGWVVALPEPGDIATWNGDAHTNLVERVEGSTIHCIDGNHEDQVMRSVRPRGEATAFIRNPKLHGGHGVLFPGLPPAEIDVTGENEETTKQRPSRLRSILHAGRL